ncbi:MAG TPA: HD domain-containing protein, partial [candidate division Zixibacteria bacterium]
MITLDDVKKNEKVGLWIKKSDDILGVIGYTEHGQRHASLSASIAFNIMTRLKHPEKRAELASIAAYLHDIGNVINRDDHAHTSAILSYSILTEMNVPIEEILEIIAAIGNHDEKDGVPVSDISAAVILADKSDVHSSRVRTLEMIKQDIHDRVNYAAKSSFLRVEEDKKVIVLELKIDTSIS